MGFAIRAEGLGKQYRIGAVSPGTQTLREAVAAAASPLAWLSRRSRPRAATIWALRDLDLEIPRGEAVGVVGSNGAGKSTLLKILSRVTRPTAGRAQLRGRVTSLLEIGTGFHPDLTGRENVFLNGAVLGMGRAQMTAKFDAIVAFAEIEKFIDTPVKHYSTGMYLRLAFAVAAHVEPEILLLDEVLGVGDAAFQRKSQERMEEIIRGGCTLLMVSHNVHAIANLCTRALCLEQGTLRDDGAPREVIDAYLARSYSHDDAGERQWPQPRQAPGNENARLRAVRIISAGRVTPRVDARLPARVEIEYWNFVPGARIYVSMHLYEESGVGVLASANLPSLNLGTDAWYGRPQPAGLFRAVCTLPGHLLNESRYSVSVFIVADMARHEVIAHHVLGFQACDDNPLREYHGKVMGVVRPRLDWTSEYLDEACEGEAAAASALTRAAGRVLP
jgi:lipopolysaccharide transport system ATP-binding protein